MMQYVVIPARYGSTRLLGKPLQMIGEQYVLFHVLDSVKKVFDIRNVRVATDNELIQKACDMYGVKSVMTSEEHDSGTSRIQEVAEVEGWNDEDTIINVQGDEPFIPESLLKSLSEKANAISGDNILKMVTACTPITNYNEVFNPNVVKVARKLNGDAMYFSRASIPWSRDTFHYDMEGVDQPYTGSCKRHIGVYAYSVKGVKSYKKLWSEVEHIEKLEQLKLLENGIDIQCFETEEAPIHGIDTSADLKAANEYWKSINEG